MYGGYGPFTDEAIARMKASAPIPGPRFRTVYYTDNREEQLAQLPEGWEILSETSPDVFGARPGRIEVVWNKTPDNTALVRAHAPEPWQEELAVQHAEERVEAILQRRLDDVVVRGEE